MSITLSVKHLQFFKISKALNFQQNFVINITFTTKQVYYKITFTAIFYFIMSIPLQKLILHYLQHCYINLN